MTLRRFKQIIGDWYFDNIYLRFRFHRVKELCCAIRRFPTKVKRIIKWIPTIYTFEVWDYAPLLGVWDKALKEQLSFYQYGNPICSEKHRESVIAAMTEMSIILNNLQDTDSYIATEYDALPKVKFKNTPVKAKDGFILYYRLNFKYKSKKDEAFRRAEVDKLFKKERRLTNKDLKRFGELFQKNILKFWD